jgi:Fic family protein
MPWNWELAEWPKFSYNQEKNSQKEKQFLLSAGKTFAYIKTIRKEEQDQFIVEILSDEGIESSKIEGEILERQSLQSSIKRNFGLQTETQFVPNKELGMAELLCSVYKSYNELLTHEMLWEWHSMLFKGQSNLSDLGKYRTHEDPMQIVSGRLDSLKVHYEAPPSAKVHHEMTKFIDWYNSNPSALPILCKAAITHIYFESIHPFEDGNGRIGRILVEKILSQGIGKPALITVSKFIEKRKKEYYSELAKCNKSLDAYDWVEFFSEVILQAQENSISLLNFLINKSKLLSALQGKLNPRQEKVLLRMFAEGVDGFAGGLNAEKYITITKSARATATRDLTELVQLGALKKTGELKYTRYWLNF